MDDGTSTKQTSVMPSEVNEDSTAIAAPRKIKVQPTLGNFDLKLGQGNVH